MRFLLPSERTKAAMAVGALPYIGLAPALADCMHDYVCLCVCVYVRVPYINARLGIVHYIRTRCTNGQNWGMDHILLSTPVLLG